MKSKKVAVLSLCGLFLLVSLSAFYFLNSEEKMSGKKIKSQLMKPDPYQAKQDRSSYLPDLLG